MGCVIYGDNYYGRVHQNYITASIEKRDIEIYVEMTSPSSARPKTTPSCAKLSAGHIIKKYQKLSTE